MQWTERNVLGNPGGLFGRGIVVRLIQRIKELGELACRANGYYGWVFKAFREVAQR